jgi:predicted Zn finger-like uncharacterized protein
VAEDSLEPLVTQCPTCRTRFRVTEVQLGVAGGRVRCGACLSVFTGIENLVAGAGPRLRPGESADSALDALLDELRNERPPPGRAAKAQEAAAVESSTPISESNPEEAELPEALPEPEVDAEAAPGDVIGDDEIDARDDEIVAAAEIDLEAEEFDLPPEASEFPAEEFGLADESPAIDAEEIELTAAAAPPAPVAEKPQAPPQEPPPPKPAAAARREGITSRPVRTRVAASATPSNPAPAVRPARAALDLAVDPDALLVVPPPRRRWWVWTLLLLCTVGLVGEALYLRFGEWAKNPQIRPVYEWLCPRLGCQLPEMRAPEKMISKNLIVRANPDVASGLLVDAIIVNEATFAQPFPDVELHFSALDGTPVKTLTFHPTEYLAGELKGVKMIAPMTPVHIALDITDPGPTAVNYVMAFR